MRRGGRQFFIGATDSLAPLVMPPILFKLTRTKAEIVCSTDHSALLVKKLIDGPLQLAFVVESSVAPAIRLRVLKRVPVICVATPRHPSTARNRLTMAEIAEDGLALYRWSPDTDNVADLLKKRGLKMPQLRQLAPLSTARAMVLSRNLACFLPSIAVADDLTAGRLVRLHVADVPRWTWDICAAYRPQVGATPVGRTLLRALNAISWAEELTP